MSASEGVCLECGEPIDICVGCKRCHPDAAPLPPAPEGGKDELRMILGGIRRAETYLDMPLEGMVRHELNVIKERVERLRAAALAGTPPTDEPIDQVRFEEFQRGGLESVGEMVRQRGRRMRGTPPELIRPVLLDQVRRGMVALWREMHSTWEPSEIPPIPTPEDNPGLWRQVRAIVRASWGTPPEEPR